MSDKENIRKAESVSSSVDFSVLPQEVGQPQIVNGFSFIQDQKDKDLQYPRAFCTFNEMMRDADVANAVDSIIVKTLLALEKGSIKDKKSKVSVETAKFLNYTIRNMTHGSWLESMNDACSCLKHGFSLLNPVLEVRKYGKYKGKAVIKKLAPRSQSSVYGWAWDKKGRDLKGVIQKPMLLADREKTIGDYQSGKLSYSGVTNGYYKSSKYTFIPSTKLLHFRFNPTNNNPQGSSPLVLCYDAYAEKHLIEQYEIIGTSKDLGGIGVLYMPLDLMKKASDPETYPEDYKNYQALVENAASLQEGKNKLIILASDVDSTTKTKDYDFQLKGIDGGGKQYKTSEIIEQKRKSIYNVFGAGFLLLGQNGHGSNALSSNQMSTHDYYVQRLIMWITDVINNQLLPMILKANNIELDWEDMPYFEPDDPTKDNSEVIGKLINRLGQAGALTNEALVRLYEVMELPIEGVMELDLSKTPSGEFEGSGNGTTQAGGASSDTNSENAA